MKNILVYEVRGPVGSVLFTNHEAAVKYRRHCCGLAPIGATDKSVFEQVSIFPRIVIEDCPEQDVMRELSVAS